MMWKTALWLAAMALPASAMAAPVTCNQRQTVLDQLSQKFKESPIAVGLANNGGLLELLTSGSGGTWTIIITMPSGLSCLVASGEDWQTHPAITVGAPQI